MATHFDNRWDGTVPLHPTDCLLCGRDRSFPVHRENGFAVVRCTSCGFVFVNPRPRPEDLRAFYDRYVPQDPQAEESWGVMMRSIFRNARDRILSLRPRGRVLDMGCGLGFFIEQFRETGWEAVGVDLSSDLAARARRRTGLDVRPGALEDQGFPDASFDAVTLFYVLEHTPDPASALREVRRVLRPGGLVLVRVPHMEPLIRLRSMFGAPRIFFHPPMHLCDLGPRVLQRLLRSLNFERVRTAIGGSTAPPARADRLVSRLSGALAGLLERATGGALLLPGVSKTTTAYKPA